MTVVEFFDKNAIENVLSALLCQPDKVLYVGNSKKQMDAKLEVYREVLASRYVDGVELDSIGLDQNNLARIVEVLSGIVESTDLCVFNLDGGEDLYLVAVGMVAMKYGNRVQLHRFNVRNSTIVDCDADGNDQLLMPIRVTVDENARIYSGRVIYEDERKETTPRWLLNAAFCQDVRDMWEISKEKPSRWNWVITQLAAMCEFQEDAQNLRAVVPNLILRLEDYEGSMPEIMEILGALQKKGLIYDLTVDQGGVAYTYKDHQVKKCLAKAGTILELYIAVVARSLFDKEEERIYHDVRTGVWLDWDGKLKPEGDPDVNNEIDVLLMRGAVPVFISCKNGDVDIDELYKLETVANRFGGKYARKVMVLTQPEKMGEREEPFRLRAAAMGIKLLTNIDELPLEKLEAELRTC